MIKQQSFYKVYQLRLAQIIENRKSVGQQVKSLYYDEAQVNVDTEREYLGKCLFEIYSLVGVSQRF